MNVSDTAMQSMETIMQRLRELAVEGSSDTLSASDRNNMQPEVDQLFRQLVSLTNTQYNGAYVFGGKRKTISSPSPSCLRPPRRPPTIRGLKWPTSTVQAA